VKFWMMSTTVSLKWVWDIGLYQWFVHFPFDLIKIQKGNRLFCTDKMTEGNIQCNKINYIYLRGWQKYCNSLKSIWSLHKIISIIRKLAWYYINNILYIVTPKKSLSKSRTSCAMMLKLSKVRFISWEHGLFSIMTIKPGSGTFCWIDSKSTRNQLLRLLCIGKEP
jgi:hypothetical protein